MTIVAIDHAASDALLAGMGAYADLVGTPRRFAAFGLTHVSFDDRMRAVEPVARRHEPGRAGRTEGDSP